MWDAICSKDSYGGKKGFLEIMGDCLLSDEEIKDGYDVIGWLTAEDVIARFRTAAESGKME